jgi:hypothetical protein
MKIKTLVVGLGKIGMEYDFNKSNRNILSHCSAIINSKKFKLVGGVDKDINKKVPFESFYGNLFFEDLKCALLKTRPNFVIISSNTSNHLEIIKKIIRFNYKNHLRIKFILIEKPMGINLFQAKKIVTLCAKSKIKLLVNYLRNYNKNFINIINKNNNYTRGKIIYSGGMINNGSHFLCLFLLLFGKILKVEKSYIKRINNYDYRFTGLIYFEKALLSFKNNIYTTRKHSFVLRNSNNCIEYDNKKNIITKKSSFKKKQIVKKIQIKNQQKIVLDQIYRFITKKNCTICTGTFALKVSKDLEKIKNII